MSLQLHCWNTVNIQHFGKQVTDVSVIHIITRLCILGAEHKDFVDDDIFASMIDIAHKKRRGLPGMDLVPEFGKQTF